MSGVQQPVEIARPPAGEELEADLERRTDGSERVRRNRAEMAALDPGDGRLRDPREPRQVALAKMPSPSHRSDREPNALVVHCVQPDDLPLPLTIPNDCSRLAVAYVVVDRRWKGGAEPAIERWKTARFRWTTPTGLWMPSETTCSVWFLQLTTTSCVLGLTAAVDRRIVA